MLSKVKWLSELDSDFVSTNIELINLFHGCYNDLFIFPLYIKLENIILYYFNRYFLCVCSRTVWFSLKVEAQQTFFGRNYDHHIYDLVKVGVKNYKSSIPRMELVEVGPSMDLVLRRHRQAAESLQKEAMKAPGHAKKVKNVTNNPIEGKQGRIYIPDQEVSKLTVTSNIKGLKRERRDAKKNKEHSKKQKVAENPEWPLEKASICNWSV